MKGCIIKIEAAGEDTGSALRAALGICGQIADRPGAKGYYVGHHEHNATGQLSEISEDGEPDTSTVREFERARRTDATVYSMLRSGCLLQQVISRLVLEKETLTRRIIELESGVPRKVVMPDGQVLIFQTPPERIPETKIPSPQLESKPTTYP